MTIQLQDGPADNIYKPHFELEDYGLNNLIIPAFFLYPQYATSDAISHFKEDDTFSAHLAIMFPPEAPAPAWDEEGQYVDGKMAIYATTHRKRLLKIGKKMTLRDVCKAAKERDGEPKDGLEVKDGYLSFVVLPEGEVESRWIDEYKKIRDA